MRHWCNAVKRLLGEEVGGEFDRKDEFSISKDEKKLHFSIGRLRISLKEWLNIEIANFRLSLPAFLQMAVKI